MKKKEKYKSEAKAKQFLLYNSPGDTTEKYGLMGDKTWMFASYTSGEKDI